MERYLVVLKSFKRMPAGLEQAYRDNVERMTVCKNQIIQHPGAVTDAIYFIEKGAYRLYEDREGNNFTYGFRIEDDFILALKELNPDPRYVDGIQSLEDGVLWRIPGSLIADLQNESMHFQFHYRIIMSRDAVHSRQSMRCSVRDGGSDNYRSLSKYSPRLLQRIPIPYLAEFTGIPENLFRHLHSSSINLNLSTKRRRKR